MDRTSPDWIKHLLSQLHQPNIANNQCNAVAWIQQIETSRIRRRSTELSYKSISDHWADQQTTDRSLQPNPVDLWAIFILKKQPLPQRPRTARRGSKPDQKTTKRLPQSGAEWHENQSTFHSECPHRIHASFSMEHPGGSD